MLTQIPSTYVPEIGLSPVNSISDIKTRIRSNKQKKQLESQIIDSNEEERELK